MISSEVTTQAKEVARKVTDHLNDQANYLRDSAVTTRYNAEEFILENPWQSIAITAAVAGFVGILVGVVISRRR